MPCPATELGAIVPFVAMQKFKGNGKYSKARDAVDGEDVRVARSGTACRAPTVGTAKAKKRTTW
jgi:hypothetical protein